MGEELNRLHLLNEGSYGPKELKDLRHQYVGYEELDIYEDQLRELYEVRHPSEKGNLEKLEKFLEQRHESGGSWVVYPWRRKIVHILNKQDFFAVRTNRNQYLITRDEMSILQSYTVGIAGLSVGNSIARSLDHSASCGGLVLTDKDSFALSNLNRVNIGVIDVGKSKLSTTMQQIYESNPYATIVGFSNGLSSDNIGQFFNYDKFIAFDEIDDFEMKVKLRQTAQERKVPVVMMTNLGDNVLIDIERHDLEQTEVFNGLAEEAVKDILEGHLSAEDKKRYAAHLVGIENVPTRALESLKDISTKLVGRPQLYSSVTISGGLASFVTRQIILGNSLKSGRYLLSVHNVFGHGRPDLEMGDNRQNIVRSIN